MLHGIGGNTIESAKQNLSYAEFMTWCAYIRRRGSLNIGRRVEQSIATLCLMFAHANFTKHEMTRFSFMPHEDEPELTLEEAMKQWQ